MPNVVINRHIWLIDPVWAVTFLEEVLAQRPHRVKEVLIDNVAAFICNKLAERSAHPF